jgi:hypothetical protein
MAEDKQIETEPAVVLVAAVALLLVLEMVGLEPLIKATRVLMEILILLFKEEVAVGLPRRVIPTEQDLAAMVFLVL